MQSDRNQMNRVIAIIAEAELRKFANAEDRALLFNSLLEHYKRLVD